MDNEKQTEAVERIVGRDTPTDADEREALAHLIGYELYAEQMAKAVGGRPDRSGFDSLGVVFKDTWLDLTRPIADAILADGSRRSVVPEPGSYEAKLWDQAFVKGWLDRHVARPDENGDFGPTLPFPNPYRTFLSEPQGEPFPPSYVKDRAQALHELWEAATSAGGYMTEEGFREAIATVTAPEGKENR